MAQVVTLALWQASQLADADTAMVAEGMWLAGLPSAGGYAPEWQLAHCATVTTCVWLKLLDLKLAVVWHATQLVEPVGMCVPCLPVAALPLWHVMQLVAAVNVPWSGLAPAQLFVLWQLSQVVAVAWMAVPGLPTAAMKLPLWQLAHCALTLKLAW